MRYRKFPRYSRWLEFESHDEYERYNYKGTEPARWLSRVVIDAERLRALVDKKSTEQTLHTFLESHPYLLPGFSDLHHGPYEGIVATKLPLGQDFVTDFAYVACNSQTLYFTCVEIESARKTLFRRDEKLHRDYLDARQQISDWLLWAQQNRRSAIEAWGALFNGKPASWYNVKFRGFLVFGRRSELDSPTKQQRWSAEAASLAPGLHTMTFDRLTHRLNFVLPDVDNDRIAVCAYRDRRFVAKRVID